MTDEHRVFWADAVADRVEAAAPEDPIVVKGGVSPSGVPHLGNVNEVMRGYYVAEVLRERGHAVRQVFTADDRDPLRAVPRTLATLDGELVGLDEVDAGALGRNLGKPYTDVPDPFGCCDSYGAHFSTFFERAADQLGVPDLEVVSNTALYEADPAMRDAVRTALERADAARDVLADHQDTVDADYVPFRPICAACGHVTGTDAVTAVDLDAGTVEYVCGDVEAGNRTIEGCGHRGSADFTEGKLPWRLEWPAQWRVLGVDFEPFGKDHAEGSWPSGTELSRAVYDREPPVDLVYEWFTLDGEPFSSSAGNVLLTAEALELVEREVLRFFFAKDPRRARDFDRERIDLLVDEFDRFEALFYGEAEGDERERARAERVYPFVATALDPTATEGTRYRTVEGTVDVGEHLTHAARVRHADGAAEVTTDLRVPPAEGDGTGAALLDAWADRRGALDPLALLGDQDPPAVDRDALAAHGDALLELWGDRVRLPYTFAAVLGMTDDDALRRRMAANEGHLAADAPPWVAAAALARVARARTWAERQDNAYNYRLQADLPDVTFDDAVADALDDLADRVAGLEAPDGEAIQAAVYRTAEDHDLEVGTFFGAGYRLFFGQDSGPKLGPLLARLDGEFVLDRLRREG